MAMAYVWRVIETAYFGVQANGNEPVVTNTQAVIDSPREAPIALLSVTWVGALANIYYGLAPSLPVTLATNAAETLMKVAP